MKTEQGIELEGIEGTAWTELKFSLATSDKQAIDQFGMSSINQISLSTFYVHRVEKVFACDYGESTKLTQKPFIILKK